MKIIVAGASGFIGSHLSTSLTRSGHDVVTLTRQQNDAAIYWRPEDDVLDVKKLAATGAEAVINLAGESVAERWSNAKKQRILSSRVRSTALLAKALINLPVKPRVFLCASAIGYYGERGGAVLTEDSTPGQTFLARVCEEWERQAQTPAAAGIRTASMRFGLVLSTRGGALPRMLKPFLLGIGGRLGTGKQYMSWITIDDVVSAIRFLLESELSGPVNVVAPNPVTNLEFTQTLGKVLHKPTLMPVPIGMAHLAFGKEMADQVLLASQRVLPGKLSESGFQFEHAQLTSAFSYLLKNRV